MGVAGDGDNQRCTATMATLGAVIYSGGGTNECDDRHRQWNTGIVARGSIYSAPITKSTRFSCHRDSNAYTYCYPTPTATSTPTATATATAHATATATATATSTPTSTPSTTPTPTSSPTATATPTATARPTPTARPRLTPRPRPTPVPRPGA